MEDKKDERKENNGKKKDNRSFCFLMHAQVDCLPGVVLDCNNHKREVCPLVEEVLSVNIDKEKQVEELKEKFRKKSGKPESAKEPKPEGKKSDNRSFCFCMHAQVECSPGVVLDCNNHKREVCPLVEEVLSVNKEKEEQVKELKEKYRQKSSKPVAQKKEDKEQSGQEVRKPDRKADNRSFCFCMGLQVDCLPGVVLDCNNKRTKLCPVLLEALPVSGEKKKTIKELRVVFDNRE